MSSQNPGLNPTGYIGTNYTNPGQDVFKTRDPLPTDIHFLPGTRWINTASNNFWVLGSVIAGTPKVANWISCGGGSLAIESLLLDDANLVNPIAGVVALAGDTTQGVETFMPVAGVAEITVADAATGQKGVVDSSSVTHGVLIGGNTQANIVSTATGSVGQFLESGGAAADPSWTSHILDTSGAINMPLTPAFSYYLASTVLNKTGNGAVYQLGTDALTMIFDQGRNFTTAGIFTAPVTGRYLFNVLVGLTGGATKASGAIVVTTTHRVYYPCNSSFPATSNDIYLNATVIADMTATNTMTVSVNCTGDLADDVGIAGNATNVFTGVSGFLIA